MLPGHLPTGELRQTGRNAAREARIASKAGHDETKKVHNLTQSTTHLDKLASHVKKKIKVFKHNVMNEEEDGSEGKGYTVRHMGKYGAAVYHNGKQIGDVVAHPGTIRKRGGKAMFMIHHKESGGVGTTDVSKEHGVLQLAKFHSRKLKKAKR